MATATRGVIDKVAAILKKGVDTIKNGVAALAINQDSGVAPGPGSTPAVDQVDQNPLTTLLPHGEIRVYDAGSHLCLATWPPYRGKFRVTANEYTNHNNDDMDYSMFLSSRAAPPPLPGFHTFLEGQDLIDANKLEATITTSPNGEVTVSHPSKNQTWHRGQRVGRGGQATIFFERSVPSPAAPSALVRVIKKQVTANGEATTTPDDIRNELAILLYFTHSSRPDLFTCAQGWFMEGPHHVIAMKLLQGDLEDHIRETKAPFSEPDTRIIARQVLDALAFMHARGFTHRDVKLNNIMVAAKPRPDAPFIRWSVRLGDFGLSQYHDDSTLPPEGRISGDGTANYKAPELFYIVDPDEPTLLRFEAKADMYALGVTIFRMLTGEAPYEVAVGDEDPQVVKKFSRDGPPEEPFDKACVSRKGRGFVRVLTMIDPSARPTAATALHMSDWLKGTE